MEGPKGILPLLLCMAVMCRLAACRLTKSQSAMQTIYEWKVPEFTWPSEEARQSALKSRDLVPPNTQPMSVEPGGNRLFFAFLSFRAGSPAALATAPRHPQGDESPLLQPYPSWEWQYTSKDRAAANDGTLNCAAKLVNVVRVRVDRFGRLWVADSGKYRLVDKLLEPPPCPAKLVVFDLNTDQALRVYVIPKSQRTDLSLFTDIDVDTAGGYDDTFAYWTDSTGFKMHTYSWRQNSSWSAQIPAFKRQLLDLISGLIRVESIVFPSPDGVYSVTVHPEDAPPPASGAGSVYWSRLTSFDEYEVPRAVLQDPQAMKQASNYRKLGSRGASLGQTADAAVDRRGIMFYTLASNDGVACWNTSHAFTERTQAVVSEGDPGYMLPSAISIKPDGDQDEVWLLSTAAIRGALPGPFRIDEDDINSRVFFAYAADLTKGTVCEGRDPTTSPSA